MTFVERVDRRGRVRERVKVGTLPFRIGRSYDCDLILDDPHVSALHAVLERDDEGRLVLRDAGSRNGLFVDGGRDPLPQVPLSDDTSVRLGRTHLRLRASDFPVPEAIPIVRRSALAEWSTEHWAALLVVPGLCVALLLFEQYRRTTTAFEPAQALADTTWTLLAFGIWIGGWALLNRLLRHRTRFVAHTTVAFAASALYTLLQWGFEWMRFFFAPIAPLQVADQVVTTGVWSLVLLGHLSVMGVAQRPLRLGIVVVGFCAILGLQLLDRYNDEMDWVSTLPYWSRLEPVDPAWLPVESADAYFAELASLEPELEELAREILQEEEDEVEDPVPEDPEPDLPIEPAEPAAPAEVAPAPERARRLRAGS